MNDEEYRMFVERKPLGENIKQYAPIIQAVTIGAITLSIMKHIKKGK